MGDAESLLNVRKTKERWTLARGPGSQSVGHALSDLYSNQEASGVEEDGGKTESWTLDERDSAHFISHIGSGLDEWFKEDFTWWERKKIYAKARWKVFKWKWLWD